MESSLAVGKLLMTMAESRKCALDYERLVGLFRRSDRRFASPVPFLAGTLIFVWEAWILSFGTRWTWIYGCDLFLRECRSFPCRRFKQNFVRTVCRRDTAQSGSSTALRKKY